MISRPAFSRLNVKQKVLKIADAVRSAGAVLKTAGILDLSDIRSFADWLETETHPRLVSVLTLLRDRLLAALPDRPVERLRALNFYFHELNALNGIPPAEGEPFLPGPTVANFDRAEKGAACPLPCAAILDNLRSPFNTGSIFRSADAFGVSSLALCGITPRPPLPKLERTALGASTRVPWRYFERTLDAVADYRAKGYRVWVLETFPSGSDVPRLETARIPDAAAFLFGNEEFGVTEDVLAASDGLLTIPLDGFKNSLNVASACAVVFYEFRRRRLSG